MSRDLKPKRTPPAKKARGGTLIGMFIGLVLGVGVAAGVVWYMNRSTLPFTKPAQPATPPAAAAANAGASSNAAGGKVQGQPVEPMALPGKPGDPVPEKRFQFYDILPGKADANPAGKPPESKPATPPVPVAKAEDKKPEKSEEAKPEEKKPVTLQAGSFSKPEDADNQKAKLAMFGQEASVQQVMVGDKVLYRVRLGPFAKPEEANKLKAELSKAGIEVSPVK